MKDWMDLDGDGKIDSTEMMFAEEMLCTSREEHKALFGDAGDFGDDTKEDFEMDAMAAGLDMKHFIYTKMFDDLFITVIRN